MKRLVIIEHEPLSKRLKEAFCIEELLKRGVCVEYWNLSKLIHPSANIPFVLSDDYVINIERTEQLDAEILRVGVEQTLFVVEIELSRRTQEVVDILRSHAITSAKIDLYANVVMPSPFWGRLLGMGLKNPIKLVAHVIKVLRRRMQCIPFKYDFVASSSPYAGRDIAINHPDYERFSRDESEAIIKSPYIVFCDTYYPFHPDHTFSEEFKAQASKEYYRDMSALFSALEERFSMPVVVAAHPKARYLGGEFGKREIISNESCNLIKFASYAITAESSALSYIMLANIPFAFIYPESYAGLRAFDMVQNLSAYCQMEAHNISLRRWEEIQFCKVAEEIRRDYIYGFLTSPESENRANADSYVELLKLTKEA